MENMGYPAVSLTGWQAGIHTTSQHSNASIHTIDHDLIDHYLSIDKVVFVAGFQGTDGGAQVLHKKSVLTAKQYRVPVEVLSSFQRIPSTNVCEFI